MRTFWRAVSAVNGGSGGRLSMMSPEWVGPELGAGRTYKLSKPGMANGSILQTLHHDATCHGVEQGLACKLVRGMHLNAIIF
jgi:hypothetical protein